MLRWMVSVRERNQCGAFAFIVTPMTPATIAKLNRMNTQYAAVGLMPVFAASQRTVGDSLNSAFSSPAASFDASANCALVLGCAAACCAAFSCGCAVAWASATEHVPTDTKTNTTTKPRSHE